MRTTIKDVAKEAEVSVTTVSLVMNKNYKASISEGTRARVQLVAERLNYVPNGVASSLVTKRTQTIGLIIPDSRNLFFAQLAEAIEAESRRYGYAVILGNTYREEDADLSYIRLFVEKRVDGLIFAKNRYFDEHKEKKAVQYLRDNNVHLVSVDRGIDAEDIPTICCSDLQGAKLAMSHLLRLGHRKIGCLTGPMTLRSSEQRLEGCKQALEEYQLPFDSSLVIEGDYEINSGERCLPYLLGKEVTAIFAFNDMMALGIYKAARQHRISIPDDISVVGYDNIFFSDVVDPGLTTVEQPIQDIAKEAVRQLITKITGERIIASQDTKFDPLLLVRGSTKQIIDERGV